MSRNRCSSNRPGLRRAASIAWRRLVVATTRTPCLPSALETPSISLRRVDRILENTSDEIPDVSERFVARESISSKKRIHGADALARVNNKRIADSDPPSHWSSTPAALTFGKTSTWK